MAAVRSESSRPFQNTPFSLVRYANSAPKACYGKSSSDGWLLVYSRHESRAGKFDDFLISMAHRAYGLETFEHQRRMPGHINPRRRRRDVVRMACFVRSFESVSYAVTSCFDKRPLAKLSLSAIIKEQHRGIYRHKVGMSLSLEV